MEPTTTFHALDAELSAAGEARDPVSYDLGDGAFPDEPRALTLAERWSGHGICEAVDCDVCGGCGRIEYRDGEPVPARMVPAGGGDTVRSGSECYECHGTGSVSL